MVRYIPSCNVAGFCSRVEKAGCWLVDVRFYFQKCPDIIGCCFTYSTNLMYFQIFLSISWINFFFDLIFVGMYRWNNIGIVCWVYLVTSTKCFSGELLSPAVTSSVAFMKIFLVPLKCHHGRLVLFLFVRHHRFLWERLIFILTRSSLSLNE